MKYFVLLILLMSGCATTSSNYQIKGQFADNRDGAILIGVLLRTMNNKEQLTNKAARLLSIRLKNVNSGKSYEINLSNKNIGMKKVEPGIYCVSRVTTYVNFSINLCKNARISVNPGELKNAGYWLAGINYDDENVRFRVFDTNAKKIDLYESASKYYTSFFDENLKPKSANQNSDLVVGYWYTATRSAETYLFDSSGKYYKTAEIFDDGNLALRGTWSWNDTIGEAHSKTNYRSLKMKEKDGKLSVIFENKRGEGVRWLAFRNPIRIWDLKGEYENQVVAYNRKKLDEVASQVNRSIYVKIKYSSIEPQRIPRVGKRLFKRPYDYQVVGSNISTDSEKLILNNFHKWRFATESKNETLTVCVINGIYPDECKDSNDDTIIFELGKRYPIHGMSL